MHESVERDVQTAETESNSQSSCMIENEPCQNEIALKDQLKSPPITSKPPIKTIRLPSVTKTRSQVISENLHSIFTVVNVSVLSSL